ncbi:hypothetical protein MCOR03_003187 [Pyricularia oryzae]|nr:hypothetical protein MCOR10_010339 [Pyricularia oryzae]KAI6562930.1 hypothetical protein MCOR03_003187 [Pyricularia oryzae]KAI6586055.1 hypothetical protein MCOR06_006961 [Pyricularia oryzae]
MDRIKALPERTAYTVLLALCNDPSILKRAVEFSELLQPPPESARYEQSASESQRKKRKSPTVYDEQDQDEDEFECARCSGTFLRSQDRDGACVYHEGDVEPDYDGFWEDLEDFDEENDGPIDTDEMRRRFPQGFFWDCCGKKLSDQGSGCRTGSHVARSAGSMKRSRFSIDEDTPDIVLSPEPPHLRQALQSQQTPPGNPYPFVDNSEDDDLVELNMQPVGGGVSSAASSGDNTVQVTRYMEINEVVELDGDSDAGTNGHHYDSGREKT